METKLLPTVVLCIGAPASGKSTWSTNFTSDYKDWVRLSRDELRYMLRNEGFLSPKLEKVVSEIMDRSLELLIESGQDVIIDNTNVKLSYINKFLAIIGDKANATYKVFDFPLEELIKRDSLRERKVGEEVIKTMYENLQTLKQNNKCKECSDDSYYHCDACGDSRIVIAGMKPFIG